MKIDIEMGLAGVERASNPSFAYDYDLVDMHTYSIL